MQRTTSQSGHVIFSECGKLLCSAKDPIKEAMVWVDFNSTRFESAARIILLGLGCGYHAFEVARRFPGKKILVIEADPQHAAQIRELFGIELTGVEIVTGPDVAEVLKSSHLQKSVQRIFVIAENHPAMAVAPAFYEELKGFLLGREKLGFQYHVRLRDELSDLFDLRKIFLANRELISIKDLTSAIKPERRGSHAADVLRCLQEFIK